MHSWTEIIYKKNFFNDFKSLHGIARRNKLIGIDSSRLQRCSDAPGNALVWMHAYNDAQGQRFGLDACP